MKAFPQAPRASFSHLLRSLRWPKGATAAALAMAVTSTLFGLVVPLVTRDFIDSLAVDLLNWKTGLLIFGVFLLQALTSGVSYYLLSYIGETIVSDLRARIWNHVLHLPVSYFDANESGETLSRITQDTLVVKQLITEHMIRFLTGIISIIGAVAILLWIDWKMTLIMLVSIPLGMALMIPLGRRMGKVARATQAEMASFSGLLGRVLGDIRLVKSYRAEKAESDNGGQAIQRLFRFGLREAKIMAIVGPLMTFILMAVLVLILGYGGAQVAAGHLTAGALVAIILYMFNIAMPFSDMARFFTAYQKAVGATSRIQELVAMETEPVDGFAASKEKALSFEDVSFRYDEEKLILDRLSFTAPPGTVTAFVGPSGGGKTTAFSLIERFYEPTAGDISYGDVPIRELSLSDWRGRIGYVSQESPLMSGTLLDNIAYGMPERPPLERIEAACRAANALEFIDALPKRFETSVGERGIKLSGGQRQRISIARAILLDPEILLLDEATSNLDSGSEAAVQEALHRLMEGRTTFVIAHRLSTILHADQLLFIEGGCITGRGTHAELFANHAMYRRFAKGQGLSV